MPEAVEDYLDGGVEAGVAGQRRHLGGSIADRCAEGREKLLFRRTFTLHRGSFPRFEFRS